MRGSTKQQVYHRGKQSPIILGPQGMKDHLKHRTRKALKKIFQIKDYSYASEKFDEAVYMLATDYGSLRARVPLASEAVLGLSPAQFPDSLRKDFAELKSALTANPAKRSEGRLRATTGTMRKKKLVLMAKRIVAISEKLETLRNE